MDFQYYTKNQITEIWNYHKKKTKMILKSHNIVFISLLFSMLYLPVKIVFFTVGKQLQKLALW